MSVLIVREDIQGELPLGSHYNMTDHSKQFIYWYFHPHYPWNLPSLSQAIFHYNNENASKGKEIKATKLIISHHNVQDKSQWLQ